MSSSLTLVFLYKNPSLAGSFSSLMDMHSSDDSIVRIVIFKDSQSRKRIRLYVATSCCWLSHAFALVTAVRSVFAISTVDQVKFIDSVTRLPW